MQQQQQRNMYGERPAANQANQSAGEQMSDIFTNLISSLFEPIGPDYDYQQQSGPSYQQPGMGMGPSADPRGHPGTRSPPANSGSGWQPPPPQSQIPPMNASSGGAGPMSDFWALGGVGPPPPRDFSGLSRSPEIGEGGALSDLIPASMNFPPSGPHQMAKAPVSPQKQQFPENQVSREVSQPANQSGNRGRSAMAPPSNDRPLTAAMQGQRHGRSQSPSGARSSNRPGNQQERPRTYQADADDLLDQHVAYYFRHHPDVYKRHQISRKRPGVYELNGREITVEWQYGLVPGEQGFLVALDGPLRQPFADYMAASEANAEYVTQGLTVNALHAVPLPARMTFDDANRAYTRLEAMKVAKEQAIVREKAAEYAQMGMPPPQDLRKQYEKTINRKLNPGQRQSGLRGGYPGAPGPPMGMPGGMGGGPPPMAFPGFAPQPAGPPQLMGNNMQGGPGPPGNLFGTPNLMNDVGRNRSPGPPLPGPGMGQQQLFRFN